MVLSYQNTKLIFLVVVFFCINSVFAQQQNIKFEHLTVEDGLSQSTIKCIIKDKQGFMWFGSENGLNKYDGYEFTIYEHIQKDTVSISGNRITCIFEDYEGMVWVGTYLSGLNKFNVEKETFTYYTYNKEDNNAISNNSIGCIYEDTKGNFWIETYGGGLNLFQKETNS
ncbi:MAG: hypothetical protein PF517_02755 [Salinivirgaceae bacterium]|jgi:ligand-binding sensor domain-containing protein|nr:hypothetical protein [Salinivirgaceae bacterium]